MANAKSNVTYISGSSQDLTDVNYVNYASVNPGVRDIYKKQVHYSIDEEDGIQYLVTAQSGINPAPTVASLPYNVDLGTKNPKMEFVGSVSDRAPNLPSGYATTGAPTYGDGKQNKVTTWADDTSPDADSAAIVYAMPASGFKKLFADLT